MVAIVGGADLGLGTTSGRELGDKGQLGSASQGRAGEGVTVNAVTGNLVLQRQDEFVASTGIDIGLIRTYNSQGAMDDDNGDNWRLGVGGQIVGATTGATAHYNESGSTVTRRNVDGTLETYTYDTSRSAYVYKNGDGAYDVITIQVNAGGTIDNLVWLDGATRQRETYNAAYQLIQVADASNNALTLTYNANGRLETVTNQSGEKTVLVYGAGAAQNNILEIRTYGASSNLLLTRVRYGYDGSNRLTTVTVDLSPNDNSVADGNTYVTTYAYDGASKRITRITQTDGSRLDFSYETSGSYRLLSYQDVRGSDIRTTSFVYSAGSTSITTSATGVASRTSTVTYDGAGQVLTMRSTQADGATVSSTFTYFPDGKVATVTDGRGNVVTYGYDAQGNRTLERDQLGNTITRTYDASNRLRMEKTFTVADSDGAGPGLPSGERTTHYVYDDTTSLRVRYVISPEGRVAEYRYDPVTKLRTAEIQYTGALKPVGDALLSDGYYVTMAAFVVTARAQSQRTDITYDFRGQQATRSTYATVDSNGVGTGTAATTQYVYDPYGRLLSVIYPGTQVETYTYDGLGRVLTATNAAIETTTYLYTDASNTTKVTLANGLMTTTQYDAGGMAVSVVRSDNAGAPNSANLATTTYTYNKFGQLLTSTGPTGEKTVYVYDANGRKIAEIDPLGVVTEYVYNAANQVIKRIVHNTPATAQQISDASNGLVTAPLTLSASALDRIDYNIYDAAGRLIKTIDAVGAVVDYFYDGAGQLVRTLARANQLTSTQLTNLSGVSGEINPANGTHATYLALTDSTDDRSTRQVFNVDGLLAGVLDAEGYLTERVYDAAGNLIRTIRYATATASANWATGTLAAWRPAADAVNDQTTYYLYDRRGKLTGVVDAESYLTEYQYNLDGNKSAEIRYATPVGRNSDHPALSPYVYSATQRVDQLRPATNAEDQVIVYGYETPTRLQFVYRYNGAFRSNLINNTYMDGASTVYLGYDVFGNPSVEMNGPGSPTVVYGAQLSPRVDYRVYDTQGRLVSEMSPLGYAALLAGAGTEQDLSTRYTYDAAGRLTSKTAPVDSKGTAERTLYFYDADGRLTHIINAAGEVTESAYNRFGNVTTVTRYGTRLSAATLNTLAGLASGVAGTTLFNALAAIANVALDSKESFSYSARDEKISHTDALNVNDYSATYNAFGQQASATQYIDGSRTRVENFGYDRRGLLKTDAVQNIGSQTFTLDAFGRVTQVIDARTNTWSKTYDRLGRVVTVTDPGTPARSTGYDAFGRVLTQTDALGYTTTYAYDSTNRTVTITSPEGIVTTTTRNAHGEVVSIKDGRNNVTSYSYDANGTLIGTTTPVGNGTATASTGSTYDQAGHLIETTDKNGVKTRYTYDAVGRVLTRVVDPSTTTPAYTGLNLTTRTLYDPKGQAVWSRDANGVWTQTQYDAKGQVTAIIVDPLQQPVVNADGTFTLDAINNNRLNIKTGYTYDNRGKTLTVTEGVGSIKPRVTRYDYDEDGRRTSERVDPTGLNLTTSYTYDANGNVVAKTDALLKVTRYVYDAKNQLIYSVDPTGAVTKIDYDAEGRVVATTAYANRISLTSPSALPVAATSADITSRLTANAAADVVNRTVYDRDGRVRFTLDGLNYVTEKAYDNAGNVIRSTRYATKLASLPSPITAASIASAVQTSAADQTTRTIYDKGNRATFVIDAAGYVIQFFYNDAGAVIKQVQYYNAMVGTFTDNVEPRIIGAASGTTAYVVTSVRDQTTRTLYDAAGRSRFVVDGEGYVTEQRYDGVGRESQRIRYSTQYTVTDSTKVSDLAGAVPATPTVNDAVLQSFYDAAGRKVRTIDPENNTTLHVFNAVGLETDTTVAYGTSDASTTHREYDAAGRLVEEAAGYDPAGMVDSNGKLYVEARNTGAATWAEAHSSTGYNFTAGTTFTAELTTGPTTTGRKLGLGLDNNTNNGVYRRLDVYIVDNTLKVSTHTGEILMPVGSNTGITVKPNTSYVVAVIVTNTGVQLNVWEKGSEASTGWTYTLAGTDWGKVYAHAFTYSASTNTGVVRDTIDNMRIADASGATLWAEDFSKPTTKLTYTSNSGNLLWQPTIKSQAVTRYVLDAMGNRTSVIDPRGVELAETDSAWALETRAKLGFIDSFGNAVTAAYVATNAPLKAALLARYTTTQQFDALGRMTGSTDALGGTIATQYDAFGNAVKVTDQLGNSGYFYFDQNNRNTLQIDPMGYATKTVYNAFGTIDTITHYATATSGAAVGAPPTPQTSTKDQTTTIAHDKRNLQTTITDAEGMFETMGYDAFGNKTSYRNKYGGTFTYTYDRNGNVLTETASAGAAQPQSVKAYVYDARGNIKQLTEGSLPEQRVTNYQYDRLNRQILKTGQSYSAFDAVSGTDYTATPTEVRKYDGRGNLIEVAVTQGNGTVSRTLYYFDALNRQVAQIDPVGQLTTWQYNGGSKAVGERAYTVAVALPAVAGGVPPTPVILGAYAMREKLYAYDANGRLLSTTIPNVTIGQGKTVGGLLTYEGGLTNVVASSVYDLAGNVTRSVDGRGNSTYYYYNSLGQKILQIDAERFVTQWTYDSSGNVTRQYQYATAFTGDVNQAASTIIPLLTTVTTNSTSVTRDRITNYSYDRLGRLTQKQVESVGNTVVNSLYGTVTHSVETATTSYVYEALNAALGLGQRIEETDATGAVTNTWYNTLGNVMREERPSYTDYNGTAVTPTTSYEYNTLGQVTRELERGLDNASEADDRITTYTYGTGGQLLSQTDPSGAVTQFRYDAAGNITKKTLVGRKNAVNTSTVDDVTTYRYDLANREIWRKDQGTAEIRETRYDVFGGITGKRLNGGGVGGTWQEVAEYNALGQIWRSNQGNSATAVQVYDANGNATLRIETTGAQDFAQLTLDYILRMSDSQKFITISQYDKRNLLTDTAQPQLSPSEGQVGMGQFITQVVGAGNSPTITASNPLVAAPPTTVAAQATGTVAATYGYFQESNGKIGLVQTGGVNYAPSYSMSVTATISLASLPSMGSGVFTAKVTGYINGVAQSTVDAGSAQATDASISISGVLPLSPTCDTVVITLYKSIGSNGGTVQLVSFSHATAGYNVNGGTTFGGGGAVTQGVYFGNQGTATKVVMAYRAAGTSDKWAFVGMTSPVSGNATDWFGFNWGSQGLAVGTAYEFRYYAFNSSHTIVNMEAGSLIINGDGTTSTLQAPVPQSGLGGALMDTAGNLQFVRQNVSATGARLYYRTTNAAGVATGGWSGPITAATLIGPGWWSVNVAGLSGNYEYRLELLNAGGAVIDSRTSTFTTGAANSVFEDFAGIQQYRAPTVSAAPSYANSSGVMANVFDAAAVNIWDSNTYYGTGNASTKVYGQLHVDVAIPAGAYQTRVVATLVAAAGTINGSAQQVGNAVVNAVYGPGTVAQLLMPTENSLISGYDTGTLRIQLYRIVDGTELLVNDNYLVASQLSGGRLEGSRTETVLTSRMRVSGQPAGTSRVMLMYRYKGSNMGYNVATMAWDGAGFVFDYSGLGAGTFEYKYVSFTSDGRVTNSETGEFGGSNVIGLYGVVASAPQTIGSQAFMDSSGRLFIGELGTDSTQMVIRYRVRGGTGPWTPATLSPAVVAGAATNGWFMVDTSLLPNNTYDFYFEAKDGNGRVTNRETGSFTKLDTERSARIGGGYSTQTQSFTFDAQQSDATKLYMVLTNTATQQTTTLTLNTIGGGIFRLDDVSSLSPNPFGNDSYTFSYSTTKMAGSVEKLLSLGSGTLKLGTNGGGTLSTSRQASSVPINPPQTTATKMVIQVRPNGSTLNYLNYVVTRADSTVPFNFPASQVIVDWNAAHPEAPISADSVTLEYKYDLYAGATLIINPDGTPAHVEGAVTIGSAPSSTNYSWVVSTSKDPALTIHRYQTHNAFGEVDSEIDGRGNVTNFAYDTQGKLTEKKDPLVPLTVKNADGTISRITGRPTTTYYYDLEGRLAGIRDANGNENYQAVLAGTGRANGDLLVTAEFHADGGVKRTAYDVFGDARTLTDELGRATQQEFDKNGRLVKVTRPDRDVNVSGYVAGPIFETYEYDQAGNRIAHTNELNKRDVTLYDSLGRVRTTTSAGGVSVIYDYAYFAEIYGNGLSGSRAQIGGYRLTTTLGDGYTLIDNVDYFGRTTEHWDQSNRKYDYFYNAAGRLASQTNTVGQNISYDYYDNGYVRSITDNNFNTQAFTYYQYDADGNRSLERYRVKGQYYQDARVTYDALNRVTEVRDPQADIRYEYDANGNRMRVVSDYHDAVYRNIKTQDYWYEYDSMNRFTITMGKLNASNIVYEGPAGGEGVHIGYDVASQRTSAHYAKDNRGETYVYTTDGYLADRYIDGVKRSSRVADASGRTVYYYEYALNGSITFTQKSGYNDDSQLMWQKEWNGVENGTPNSSTTYDYIDKAGTTNDAGPMLTSTNVTGGSSPTTTITSYEYDRWDEAKQLTIKIQASAQSVKKWAPGYSHFNYDQNGHITQVDDLDELSTVPNPRYLTYVVDAQGLVLARDEHINGQATSNGKAIGGTINIDKHHVFYYLNGHRIGDVSNQGDIENPSYAEELAREHSTKSRKDGYKNFRPISSADFDQNYIPISYSYPGATSTTYTVRANDTLQSIAASVWGDSAMWYLLADANGLNGSETLKPGQILSVPNKVTNIHNNSSTFKVYDAGEALGDVNPTLPAPPPPPKPKKKKGCGGIGKLLSVVVAIVATVFTAGAALAVIAPTAFAAAGGIMAAGMAALGGASIGAAVIGGALGSVIAQGIGMATGLQDKFSWGSVAMSAIGAGVGAGVGQLASGSSAFSSLAGKGIGATVGRAVVSNVATQGIAVATGLQEKFSWTQVAASAVGSAVSFQLGDAVSKAGAALGMTSKFANNLFTGTTLGMINGGVQSLITGQRPNWGAIAADSFGNALGSGIAGSIVDREQQATAAEIRKGGVAALEKYLKNVGLSEQQVDAFKADNQHLLSGMQALRQKEAELGKSFENMTLQEQQDALSGINNGIVIVQELDGSIPANSTSESNPLRSVVRGGANAIEEASDAVGWLVNRLGGPDNAAAAVFGVQAFIGGVPKAVLNLATGTATDALFGEARNRAATAVGDLIAEHAFGIDASSTPGEVADAQMLGRAIADFGISTIVDRAKGVINSSLGVSGARAKLDGPVRPGQEATYGELKAQKRVHGETEPLDMDHQPSFASQVAAQEAELGRKLGPDERRDLKNNSPAVASPRDIHQKTSPTYGGRNTPERIAEDAADRQAAQARDRAILDKALKERDEAAKNR